jgi:hypothetical protein
MNLIEAVKSGKPFRSDPGCVWMVMDEEGYLIWAEGRNQVSGRRPPSKKELLLDTWEIKEPEVTITRTQLLNAVEHVKFQLEYPYGENPRYAAFATDLAKHLGLGD